MFTRLGAQLKLPSADKQVELAAKTIRQLNRRGATDSPVAWLNQLRADGAFFAEVRNKVGQQDPFAIEREAATLRKLLGARKDDDALVSFSS